MRKDATRYLGAMRACLLLLAAVISTGSGRPEQDPTPPPSWTFGVSLATGQNSELYSLFLVKEHGLQLLSAESISREQFVLQAQGIVPSKANPDGENFFLRYDVRSCMDPEDSTAGVRNCGVFDDLWKLRFWEYPFHPRDGQHPGLGWSENRAAPSARQMLLLSDYGILYLTGMARGENAFRLLRDVGDPEWVENYRKGY